MCAAHDLIFTQREFGWEAVRALEEGKDASPPRALQTRDKIIRAPKMGRRQFLRFSPTTTSCRSPRQSDWSRGRALPPRRRWATNKGACRAARLGSVPILPRDEATEPQP